ncbi:MAG: PD-(D/E)XK nuclease family protein [Bifidobacteriaceae bacterium]|nr:PD-(D/E)XK nuclease family protein [Bifidobacteriaceae bacterium]
MTSLTVLPTLGLAPPARLRVRPDQSQEEALALVAAGDDVTVLGAPGSGKTLVAELAAVQAMRGRRSAVVLSGSRHSARALSSRIMRRHGGISQTRPAVTPGALAMTILKARAGALAAQPWDGAVAAARGLEPQMVSGSEQLAVLTELLQQDLAEGLDGVEWPPSIPARTRRLVAFRSELRDLLMRAAERGLGAEGLYRWGVDQDRPDWVAAAHFYGVYLDNLALRNTADSGLKLDAAAMVAEAYHCLRDWSEPITLAGVDVRLDSTARPHWDLVIVDDYQNASLAVHRLVAQLGADGSQLLVLGSPESASQVYRGGLPGQLAQTLLDPAGVEANTGAVGWGARPVVLRTSWRQPAELARCAHAIRRAIRSAGLPRAARQPLEQPDWPDQAGETAVSDHAERPGQGVVRVAEVASEAAWVAAVARRLRWAHIVEQVPWSQMAVLARTTGQVAQLGSDLVAAGLPVYIPGSEVLSVDQRAVAPLIEIMRCAIDPVRLNPETAGGLLVSVAGGLDAAELRALLRSLGPVSPDGSPSELGQALEPGQASEPGQVLAGMLKTGQTGPLEAVPERLRQPVIRLAQALSQAREQMRSGSWSGGAAGTLWAVWEALGLAEGWQDQALRGGAAGWRADASLDAVLALFAAANRYDSRNPGSDTDGFLDYLAAQEVPADTVAAHAPIGERVTVSTATASVGREWDVVAVAGLQEDIWPDLRLRDTLLGAARLADLADGKDAPDDLDERRRAVLEDEARLLLLAVTRARREVICWAVKNDEATPSRFLDLLSGQVGPVPAPSQTPITEQLPDELMPFDLNGVVAEARRRLIDGAALGEPDQESAQILAALADLGIPGADPASWPGLLDNSSTGPIYDAGSRPRLSPSGLDVLNKCPLRWALTQNGGSTEAGPEAKLGTLIHHLAQRFGTPEALHQAPDVLALTVRLESALDQSWDGLGLGETYSARLLRRRASRMVRGLALYLDQQRDLAFSAAEVPISDDPGSAAPDSPAPPDLPVRLAGRIDRLEVDQDGGIAVVDFKTTANPGSPAEAATNPQLGVYQLALQAGLVEGFDAATPAAAKLVYLDATATAWRGGPATVRQDRQPPIATDTPWMVDLLARCVAGAPGPTFEPVLGDHCQWCQVASSCPAQPSGKQVTA